MFKFGIIVLCGLSAFLPIGAHSESYDSSLEVTAPGEWMTLSNLDWGFRFISRCGGTNCLNNGYSTTLAIQAPEGWELKWEGNQGGGQLTILKGTAGPGERLRVMCQPTPTSNAGNPNVFGCWTTQLKGRRLNERAGSIGEILVRTNAPDVVSSLPQSGNTSVRYPAWVWVANSVRTQDFGVLYQPKVARLDYSSHVHFNKGERVRFLNIAASANSAILQVELFGSDANVLALGNSDTGAIGSQVCNGAIRTGMTCFVTTKDNMEWYGEKQATARITLTII